MQLTIGDTFQYTVSITDDAGDPYDLLDCTLWFTAKRRYSNAATVDDSDAIAALYWVSGGASDGIAVDDAATGEAVITLTPAQTSAFAQAAHQYDLQLSDFDGDIHTVDQGTIVVLPGVTTRTTTP